jgi:ABC-type phosphate/phosphonate transport system substrate-binding protein
MAKHMIVLPITLEQLITTIKQLQPSDRSQVAQALIQLELQSDLKGLIEELYSQTPVDEITDSDIMHEIKAVRQNLNK